MRQKGFPELALAASIALSGRASLASLLVWLFNLWGAADLLFAFYQGQFGLSLDARMLGAAFFIGRLAKHPACMQVKIWYTHGCWEQWCVVGNNPDTSRRLCPEYLVMR